MKIKEWMSDIFIALGIILFFFSLWWIVTGLLLKYLTTYVYELFPFKIENILPYCLIPISLFLLVLGNYIFDLMLKQQYPLVYQK
ncbi:MAG: hypothetical protein A3K77_05640 [Euryarchaeota archaeon RBG_13_31_8]|nr:MAG: hypothetical protein A3K77_05640 [Euryarchaeota archaeon RBG_13_31_8]